MPKYVAAADAYGFAGCASRICFQLVHVIYALNLQWPPPDRVALSRTASLSMLPANFEARVQDLLGHIGTTASAQTERAAQLRDLSNETVRLSGDRYVSRALPTSDGRRA